MSLLSQATIAATVQADELELLRTQARKAGSVSVLVHVHNASLQQIAENSVGVRAATETRIAAVLKELGDSVLQHGQWANGMGQMGFHVTAEGLLIRKVPQLISGNRMKSGLRASISSL